MACIEYKCTNKYIATKNKNIFNKFSSIIFWNTISSRIHVYCREKMRPQRETKFSGFFSAQIT